MTANFVQGSDNEEYNQTLPTSEKLFVRLDRTQVNSTLTSGQVWIEKNGKKVSMQKFSTFKEMREIVKKMLKTRKAAN
ncbi:hypothetical protein [Argonema antarcticum]|uniref:hypothetical protein n=1 Tax=Argonema antarcticum TaxID=2942763 RepID=UPI0020122D74|nr:hypothetical protein [Argonema antarcticum]MCL1475867.1 hypothetical protein [Argonema antarcticum A004/B2]